LPTLGEVARLAGVSVATVSNVVKDTKHVAAVTCGRVERAAAEASYVPNQAVRALAHQKQRRGSASEKRKENPPGWDSAEPSWSGVAEPPCSHRTERLKLSSHATLQGDYL
jgi:hypothetical protein